MVTFEIKWSDLYPFVDKEGRDRWRRHWVIPQANRTSFFQFWNTNKYRLWNEGFSVAKQDSDWVVYETKADVTEFKKMKGAKIAKPKEDVFWLPPYKVKNEAGLRPWQVESVSKLVSSINKFGCAIDGSDLGVGKTFVACVVARELKMKMVVVCPKAVMESWRRVINKHFNMGDKLVDIINYEQLRIGKKESKVASYILNKKTHREKFIWKITKDTLIIWDESQKLKNWKTKNSKTCIEAFKQGYRMLFCSATNATNPLELRTVGTVLGLFKGSVAYYQWCYEHGVSKGRFGLEFTKDIELRSKVLKKLHNDIFVNRGIRLSRDTIPNFPQSEIIADCYNMDDEDVKKINAYHKEMESELKRLQTLIKRDKSSEFTAILRMRQQTELVKVP